MKHTLLLCLDALRPDYITKKYTPFLYKLKQENNYKELIPTLEYGFQSSLLTGKKPEQTNQWIEYKLKTNKKRNSLLSKIIFKLFGKKVFAYYKGLINFLTKNYYAPPIINNPLYVNENFELQIRKHPFLPSTLSYETFYDIMQKKEIKYWAHEWPFLIRNNKITLSIKGSDEARTNKIINSFRKNILFYYTHLVELDKVGHKNSVNSREVKKCLIKTDKLTKKIVAEFYKKFPENNLIIYSDHGMLEIKNKINILPIIKKLNIEKYFIDSTIARFWINENEKTKLVNELKKIKGAQVLSLKDKKKLGINFENNFFGDVLFLCEPGNIFLPNFFQDKNDKIKGMHGYDTKIKGHNGILITNLELKNKKYFSRYDLNKLIVKEINK